MKTKEAIQAARSSANKINLQEVTNKLEFAPPAPCWMFPDSLFMAAKKNLCSRASSKFERCEAKQC